MRRRQLLAALPLLGATAGCAGPPTADRADGDPSPTGTTRPRLDQLAFGVTLLGDDPGSLAGVRATLANEGERAISFGTGPTLAFAYVDGPGRLLLYPATPVGPNDRPAERTDGCWRYTDDFLVRSSLERRTLGPGEALEETYDVYTVGTDGPCRPPGTHRFEEEVRRVDESASLTLRLVLSVDEAGRMSVDAEQET